MNLLELRDTYPTLFYPNQDWFVEEPFALAPIGAGLWEAPHCADRGQLPQQAPQVTAGQLAEVFTRSSTNPIWESYFWTADMDRFGQRVYVGGVNQGRIWGFQVHRHLAITERWGTPFWPDQ